MLDASAIIDMMSGLAMIFGFYGPIIALLLAVFGAMERDPRFIDLSALALGLAAGVFWFPRLVIWIVSYWFDPTESPTMWAIHIVGLILGAALAAPVARLGRIERFKSVLFLTGGIVLCMAAIAIYYIIGLAMGVVS